MTRPITCNWFAPARHPRSLAVEARDRSRGWFEIVRRSRGPVNNFGDELAPYVLEDATGRPVRWAPFGKEDVNVIGSNIVHYARNGGAGMIWGMGVHDPVLTAEEKARVAPKVLAIRGPNSRDHVGLPDTTTLGDPGLLARVLAPANPRRNGKKLLIAHFSAFASKESRDKMKRLENSGFEVVLPNTHPLEMIWRIAAADFVACSGLHGTIISHAVGTPVTLYTYSDAPDVRPAYKYVDYFASIGREPELVHWNDLLEAPQKQAQRIESAEAIGQEILTKVDPMVSGLYAAAESLR